MSDVKFELNLPGLNELMKSPEMQGVLNSAAAQIAGNAGSGEGSVERAHSISFVAIASVRGSNENGDLEKAMGGVRI